MAKRRISFLISLFILGGIILSISCNLPSSSKMGGGLSHEDALQLVLEEVVQPDQLGDDPLVVFGWPEALGRGDALHPYNFLGEDPIPGLVLSLEVESWFFWIEDEPFAGFSHPTRYVLVDIKSGELSLSDQEFFNDYNARFQAADIDGLLSLLHPAVLDLYGFNACQAYLTTAVEKPIEIVVLQVLSFESWTWEIDGHSTLIDDAYSI